MDDGLEKWAAGDVYEDYMGRWSRAVAPRFLELLAAAPGLSWLDVGCGTGVLTRAIAQTARPGSLVGLDASIDFVEYARHQRTAAHFLVADGRALALCDESFDLVVSALALNFIPEPEETLKEMRRVTRPRGLVAAYVWDYAGKMEFLRYFWDAAVAENPAAAPLHEGSRFPICDPDALRTLWQGGALKRVRVDSIEIPTHFAGFDSYWRSFLVGHFPSPRYVASLDDAQRSAFRDRLRADVPTEADGSIHLVAHAPGLSPGSADCQFSAGCAIPAHHHS